MKKLTCMAFTVVLAFLLASTASAQIVPEKISASPFIGGYSFYHKTYLRDNLVFGLRVGYDITEHWGVEGAFDYVPTKLRNGGNSTNVFGYRLDALYHFMPREKLVPFLAAGVGGTTSDKSAGSRSSETDSLINYGCGVKYFLTEALALRADIRHLWVFDGGRNDWEYTLGLTYLFGAQKAKPAPIAAIDSDNDGVPDAEDRCPDTPIGTNVDHAGCTIQKKAPITKAPEKVSIALEIEFDTAKADIKSRYHEKIKKVADFMTAYPETTAAIEGHTDNVGNDSDNLKLSERRAESVKAYLIEKFGIASERLSAKGFGPSQPVADNATAAGRQKNRRINAIIESVKQ